MPCTSHQCINIAGKRVSVCARARACSKEKVREPKGTHFESGKRERGRGMQTGHAMTKEERMFRATENSSVEEQEGEPEEKAEVLRQARALQCINTSLRSREQAGLVERVFAQ